MLYIAIFGIICFFILVIFNLGFNKGKKIGKQLGESRVFYLIKQKVKSGNEFTIENPEDGELEYYVAFSISSTDSVLAERNIMGRIDKYPLSKRSDEE
ncbi:MAG: hypothetical protein KAT32_03635 [Candidatus Moranbacteria bacterium]|nr:hypothetical protein [Candidatus Moranbacteria bacterium]